MTIHDMTAVDLLAAYKSKKLSPVEVTDAVIQHIEAWEPKIKALYAPDFDGARKAAKASEKRWQAGAAQGVLDGVPITIKENIATKGVPVPLGTAATEMVPAAADAPAAARVREAGAIILAKTTMPDYGMLSSGRSSFHPLTRNPWNLAWNPGGSSAGAGAAAAAGYGPLHLGTDIGGSVRLPACWNGIFTLKPSLGRVPADPPFFGRVIGPMTRTVADSALLMAELSKPDARDHMSLPPADIDWSAGPLEPQGLKIGLYLDAGSGLPVDPEVKAAVEAAARLFADAGAKVETLDGFLSPEMLHLQDLFWRVRSWVDFSALSHAKQAKRAALHRRLVPRRRRRFGHDGDQGRQQLHGDPRRDDAGDAAVRLRAVAGLASADLQRRVGDADQRRQPAARAHLLHHAVQHERAAGLVDQLRIHEGRQADRPADRRPPLRRCGRDAPVEVVRGCARAAEEMARAVMIFAGTAPAVALMIMTRHGVARSRP